MQTQELQIKIGKKVKELRTINDWTQEEAAKELHMCRNTYSDIELGKSDLSLSRLVQLANFYKVDVDYFVSEDKRVVFYLTGNQKAEANNSKVENQCHEYHGDFAEEKLQMQLEMKDKELAMKDREIENLREIIALLKREPPQP
jgi:transcriptional regulator with XRE-family HTH domain